MISIRRQILIAMSGLAILSAPAARPDFYGVVLTSDDVAAKPYLGKFRAGYSPVPEKIMELDYMSGCSGVGIDGDFYYMTYDTNSQGNIISVDWVCVDPDDKVVKWTKPQDYALGVCMDMTYDVTTSRIYGISAVSDALVSIDPATGEAKTVAPTMPFYTMSADAAGQLYAIALDGTTGNGVLYSVNKSTGNAVKIGDTGVCMLTDEAKTVAYFQSAAFSMTDGMLYWCVTTSDNASSLYCIDAATGKASYLAPFPNGELFVGLFDVPTPAVPGAPAPVSNVSVKADPSGAMMVDISFKAPSKKADGSQLDALTGLDIYRANSSEPLYSVPSPKPGVSYSYTDTGAKGGINAYRIVAVNGEGESTAVYASAFCGEDYPAAPTGLTVKVDESTGRPQLSWTAPTKGLNGLDVDPSKLTYTISRDTNGKEETVATGVKETAFTDETIDLTRQSYPYYYVRAASTAGEGLPSAPAGTYIGPAYQLPLVETFKDCIPATSPWILQSLNMGGAWELNYVSTFPGSGPYVDEGMLIFLGFHSVAGAEARISTPILTFENARNPELRFHFYYLDMADEDLTFDDRMVVEVSVDGGEYQPVAGGEFIQHSANTRWTECVVPLAQYAGSKRISIGFHGYSDGGFDLLLDNIKVQEGDPGAVDSIAADGENADAEYFTLDGIRMGRASLVPGLYIRRSAGRADKVIVR